MIAKERRYTSDAVEKKKKNKSSPVEKKHEDIPTSERHPIFKIIISHRRGEEIHQQQKKT